MTFRSPPLVPLCRSTPYPLPPSPPPYLPLLLFLPAPGFVRQHHYQPPRAHFRVRQVEQEVSSVSRCTADLEVAVRL